ncbi:hypothetical protein [Rossellomorea marisflavi]|uniref:hypothetical protein n=1 Tax=Rossellomorea marisflavi TaxID=189381 RepID=UPI00345CDBF8
MFILEGLDGCFKTTVAGLVSKKLGIEVVKGSTFEHAQCTNEELFEKFKELAKLENVVLDRFIYSNQVYATLYQDFAILTKEQRKDIESSIHGKAKLFYLHADDKVVQDRITTRGDEYVDVSMVPRISKEYTRAISEAGIPVISYDTNEWTSEEIAEDIVRLVR